MPHTILRQTGLLSLIVLSFCLAACSPNANSSNKPLKVVHLSESFDLAMVAGGGDVVMPESVQLRFDGPLPEPKEAEDKEADSEPSDADEPTEDPAKDASESDDSSTEEDEDEEQEEPDFSATYGFEPLVDIEELAVTDGLLTGQTTGDRPVLRVDIQELEQDDVLHSIKVRLRVSEGGTLGMRLMSRAKLEREELIKNFKRAGLWMLSSEVKAGEKLQTVTVELGHLPAERLGDNAHLFLQPTDAVGASFAIEEIRFISLREHLAGVPSGFSWQGLNEVFRESLVLRAPEIARIPVNVHDGAWVDLSIGTIAPHPVTFRAAAHVRSTGEEVHLLRRTVTTPNRWETVPLDLDEVAGREVDLVLSVESPQPGSIGLFGSPIVRTRSSAVPLPNAPRGVIVILADTLRRDHLKAYGYERETAPTVSRLASEGALFLDNISQGTWTKVSVPSMLTSTYPASNGIFDAKDQLPDSVTTLAESFQNAGYATFATSSVFFTGKLSNLHQGLDVLHERNSLPKFEHSRSKTARAYVDRMLDWIEAREGGPFYARLHVFDPHDPYLPYAPYDELWSDSSATDSHEEAVEQLAEWQKENDEEEDDMPSLPHFDASKVSSEEFVKREIDWYDESIRGMDVELARMFERLEEMGLADDILVAFVSDHGEEFLEHGKHFHGIYTYGEMTNVPLILWGQRWVPPGTVVSETVQTLDMMPTILDLAGLRMPEQVQGQSLVPLMAGAGEWQPRPAISERRRATWDREPEPNETESHSIVHEGYRLVHNFMRPEGWPEYQLFDHVADPINLNDIAADHPDLVADMRRKLELWRVWAEAHPLEGTGESVELTPEQQADLEALGY